MKNPLLKVSLKWGMAYAVFQILYLLISYALSIKPSMAVGLILWVFTTFVIVLIMINSNKEYRIKYLDNRITYWQCFFNNLILFSVGTFSYIIFFYLFYTYIDSKAFQEIIDTQCVMIENNSNIPTEMKEKLLLDILNQTPISLSIKQIWSLAFGLILSFIVSIFTKRNPDTLNETIKYN